MPIGKVGAATRVNPGPTSEVSAAAIDLLRAFGGDKGNKEAAKLLEQMRDVAAHNESVIEEAKAKIIEASGVIEKANAMEARALSQEAAARQAEAEGKRAVEAAQAALASQRVNFEAEVRARTIALDKRESAIAETEARQKNEADHLKAKADTLDEKERKLLARAEQIEAAQADVHARIARLREIVNG